MTENVLQWKHFVNFVMAFNNEMCTIYSCDDEDITFRMNPKQ